MIDTEIAAALEYLEAHPEKIKNNQRYVHGSPGEVHSTVMAASTETRDRNGRPTGERVFHRDAPFQVTLGTLGQIKALEQQRVRAGSEREIASLKQQAAKALADADRARSDRDAMAEQLRVLRRNEDPGRVDRKVREEVDRLTSSLTDVIAGLRSQASKDASEIADLKAAKKRLKAARR